MKQNKKKHRSDNLSDAKEPRKTSPKLPDKEPIKTVNLQANRTVTKKSSGNAKK